MGLLDKVKETAQKGADAAKGGVKRGPGEARRHEAKKKVRELKEELGGVVVRPEVGHARRRRRRRDRAASWPRSPRPRRRSPRPTSDDAATTEIGAGVGTRG